MIYDIVIIGGGINGAAIARDASLRGLSVLLLEKSDFGAGASTKTSKLVHGGVRYLEQYNFSLVKEALCERQLLLKNAPHLVHPLRFIIPIYDTDPKPAWLIDLGLMVYDGLAWMSSSSLPRHKRLTKEDVTGQFPSICSNGLLSGISFYDAQMKDDRILMENIVDACKKNADIYNDATVINISSNGNGIHTVFVRNSSLNEETSFKGKTVVNVTGAWSSQIQKMEKNEHDHLVPTKGVHIVVPEINPDTALVLRSHIDGRVFFILPWEGFSLVGTTDTLFHGNIDNVTVDDEDRRYLIESIAHYFPQSHYTKNSILGSFAGIRPLVASKSSTKPSEISRSAEITSDGNGFITVIGGKYTTHRKVAEGVVDDLVKYLQKSDIPPCTTATTPLPGALDEESMKALYGKMVDVGLTSTQIFHLLDTYGKLSEEILAIVIRDNDGREPLSQNSQYIVAEVTYAVEKEFLKHLYSWVQLRTTIAYTSWNDRAGLEKAAQKMGALLGWSEDQVRQEMLLL